MCIVGRLMVNKMKQIFYKRGKGRVTKSLSVYETEKGYRMHYLIFDRTKITKEQRLNGEKEKRFKTLDEEYDFFSLDDIREHVKKLPILELTTDFIKEFT